VVDNRIELAWRAVVKVNERNAEWAALDIVTSGGRDVELESETGRYEMTAAHMSDVAEALSRVIVYASCRFTAESPGERFPFTRHMVIDDDEWLKATRYEGPLHWLVTVTEDIEAK